MLLELNLSEIEEINGGGCSCSCYDPGFQAMGCYRNAAVCASACADYHYKRYSCVGHCGSNNYNETGNEQINIKLK